MELSPGPLFFVKLLTISSLKISQNFDNLKGKNSVATLVTLAVYLAESDFCNICYSWQCTEKVGK